MKICTKCKEQKELIFFSKNKREKSGYQCWCKACMSEANKSPAAKARDKAYREENKEIIKQRKRKYAQENRDKERARVRAWREKNPEAVKIIRERSRAKRPGVDAARIKDWAERHPERKNIGRKELRPKYVAYVLTRREKTLSKKDIPKELIELKTIQLKINRLLKGVSQ